MINIERFNKRKQMVDKAKEFRMENDELIESLQNLIEYYIEADYDLDDKCEEIEPTGNPWLNDIVVFNQCIEIIKERTGK